MILYKLESNQDKIEILMEMNIIRLKNHFILLVTVINDQL